MDKLQGQGFGADRAGTDLEQAKRTTKVCMGTVKAVHYWAKEVTGNFSRGTDGPMIAKSSAIRLERVLAPHLAMLQKNRDECLRNPSEFFTYTMMSLRPAMKDYMLWVDPTFKTYDDQVLEEMERSKESFCRAGSEPTWQAPEPYLSR